MKIAVVSHDSFWPIRGGGGIRVYWVVKKFIERGHDVTVIAPFQTTKGLKEEFPTIKIKNLGAYSRFDKNKEIKYSQLALKIISKLLFIKIDGIYANSIVAAFPSYVVSRIRGIPLIFDMIDLLTGYSKNKKIQHYGKKLEILIAKKADCLITMSKSLRKELNKNNVKRRIHTVLHGVNLSKFIPKRKLEGDKIIYLGGIEDHDGLILLPEVARYILKKYPNIKFEIIGDGSYLNDLVDKVMKYKLIQQFDFISWIKNEDIPNYLIKAKIGVIPNLKNPANEVCLPLKGLEYMAMKIPVIASDLPGIREEIGNNQRGLLFEPGNPRDFAKKILRLLDNKQLRTNLGRAGRHFVEKNCDWNQNAQKIVEISEKYIKNR